MKWTPMSITINGKLIELSIELNAHAIPGMKCKLLAMTRVFSAKVAVVSILSN